MMRTKAKTTTTSRQNPNFDTVFFGYAGLVAQIEARGVACVTPTRRQVVPQLEFRFSVES